MNGAQRAWEQLTAHLRETALLASTESLLDWDEQCLLQPQGATYRAEQMTLLAGLIHARRTDPRIGEWLAVLGDSPDAADPHSDTGATVREVSRQYQKRLKLPASLVEELARTAVLGRQAWLSARANDDFATFAPLLEKLLHLKRQQAEAIGYAETPYDALLDDFEPGARTVEIAAVLAALRDELTPLVAAIHSSGRQANVALLAREYPIERQEAFGRQAAAQLGFDFSRGRLDVTAHPFCTSLGPHDCRITTRYDAYWFPGAFFGILHEAGHGMYDQGLPEAHYGLPLGEAVSMGIHESQSRLWENLVGRSFAYWEAVYPALRQAFPAATDGASLHDFYFAINAVRPSLIRTEADEATYNLHIVARFELEQALLSGDLPVADLPQAWRDTYRRLLGVQPTDDAHGSLQDIHWSGGALGYFPTYTLGNLYAAQWFDAAEAALGPLDDSIRRGEFAPLREWLRANIHCHGQRYRAAELVERISGSGLSHAPLIRRLRDKLAPLYGL